MLAALRFRRETVVIAIVATFAAAFLFTRPTVVERWSLYASATGGPPAAYPLFLEPFPTQYSCEVEARLIVRNGGHAVCRSRLKLESGTAEQELLWVEFGSPSARWIALCQARLRGTASREPARLSRAAANDAPAKR